ncbi:MAG TPA: Rieske 2Fe-2S domain-containing protein [Myxococcaceae bacterium]|nr:Rieske 2Fe-2S domain-containing protein [Myxococcaceae bacterium]
MSLIRIRLGPADFAEGEMRGFEVGKSNIVVAKVAGVYRALDDWCNHAGCLLSGGHLAKNLIVCPCHEVGFDLTTGKNMTSPGICDDQRAFKIAVNDGQLFLEEWNPEW